MRFFILFYIKNIFIDFFFINLNVLQNKVEGKAKQGTNKHIVCGGSLQGTEELGMKRSRVTTIWWVIREGFLEEMMSEELRE